jgi:hypothetical protein
LNSVQEIEYAEAFDINDGIALAARNQPDGSHYLGYINRTAGYSRILKYTGGSLSNMFANQPTTFLPGDKIRFTVVDDYLSFERIRNGIATLIGDIVDPSPLVAGKVGFVFESAAGYYDNYSVIEHSPANASEDVFIDCGGSGDAYFVNGLTYDFGASDVSGISNEISSLQAASARYAVAGETLSYFIAGLTVGATYQIRLYFTANPSARTFHIDVDGNRIETAFNPYAAAGNVLDKASRVETVAVATKTSMLIDFTGAGEYGAIVSAIRVTAI